MAKLYNNIMRETRVDADRTQEQIAEYLEITKQQYSLYETGKRQMPTDKLKKLCLYYGVSADYMLGLPKGLKWPR